MKVYDLPTESAQVGGMPQLQGFDTSGPKDVSGAQLQEMGTATTKGGLAVMDIAKAVQNDLDTAKTKEMDNNFSGVIRGVLYDPENGYLGKNSKSAVESRADAVKKIQDAARNLESGLTNDVQRFMFKKAAMQRMQSAMLQIDSHAMNQAKVYNVSEAKARMDGARMDALSNWAGWEQPNSLFSKSRALMLSEAASVAEVAGIPKNSEQYKLIMQASATQLHSDVINNMISLGQTNEAKKYYDAAIKAKEILPDKIDELNSKVKVATVATDGDNLAEEAFSKFMGGKSSNDPIPLFQMERYVREKAGDKEDVQRAAIAGVKERASSWNAEQIENKAQNISGVWKLVDAGKPVKQIELSPSWLALSDTERHQIRTQIDSYHAGKASRSVAEMQRAEHMVFLQNGSEYLTVTDPNVLRRMSRAQVEATRGKFGMSATQHLLDKWDAIQNPTKFGDAKIDSDDFDVIARNLGLDPANKKNKDMRNQVGALKFHIETVIDYTQAQAKRPLTRQEKMDLVNKELSKQVLVNPGVFSFSKNIPVISLTKEQRERVIIPDTDRKAIAEAMKIRYEKTNNSLYAPTEANMRRFYLMSISPAGAATYEGEK